MTTPRLHRYCPLRAYATRELGALRDACLRSLRFSEMNDPMEAFDELGSPEDPLIDAMLRGLYGPPNKLASADLRDPSRPGLDFARGDQSFVDQVR